MAVATGTALLIGGGLAAAGAIGGSYIQGEASKDAARAQRKALKESQILQQQGYKQAQQYQQPFVDRGGEAFQQLSDLVQQGPQDFNIQDLLANDPGVQFAQEQAQKGVLAAGGAQGRRFSGGTLRELQRERMGLAGQQAGQAFNRQLLGRQQQIGELQGISNIGFNTAGNLGNQAIGQAGQLSNIAQSQGNVEAARQIGEGQMYSGALNGGTNALTNMLMQQAALGQGGASTFQNPEQQSGFIRNMGSQQLNKFGGVG